MFDFLPLQFYAYSSLFNAIAIASMAIFVVVKRPNSKLARALAAWHFAVSFWAFFYFLWLSVPDNSQVAGFLLRTCMLGLIWLPPLFIIFTRELIQSGSLGRIFTFGVGMSFFQSLTLYTPYFADGTRQISVIPYWLIPGPLFVLHVFYLVSVTLYCLAQIFKEASNNSGRRRNQLLWVFASYSLAFAFGCSNYLCWYGVHLPPVANGLIWLMSLGTTYAIVKHKLFDINIVIRKTAIYSLLAAFISALYFSLVFLLERFFQDTVGYSSLGMSLLIGFALSLGFIPLRNFVQNTLDRFFFKGTQVALAAENQLLRRELIQSEAMKAVATFAAGLAHEIKNPLTAIKTFSDYVHERGGDPMFCETYDRIIGKEVDRIRQTVQQLLDFAKPRTPEKEPIKLTAVLDETLELLSKQLVDKRITVERRYASAGAIEADAKQIKQVVLNLVLNAIDAVEPGVHPAEGAPRLIVGVDGYGPNVIATISDNGHGISKEDLRHIFDPFYSKKEAGSGLGLAVVQTIIQEHGGDVLVGSHPGQGTTFEIVLPKRHESPQQPSASRDAAQANTEEKALNV